MAPVPTVERGLDSAEAQRLLAAHGPNRPPEPPPRRLPVRVWTQVRDPMILLLLAAGTLTAVLHDLSDTLIIAAVVVFNTATGVVQEVRADRAIAALHAMVAPTARVVRDGEAREVPAEDVVPGDLLLLTAGEVVPADAVLTSAHGLELDESSMTGESLPVARSGDEEVTGGTLVTRGRATATVSRTGADSGLGKLAAMMAASPVRATPLQRRLTELSRWLVGIVLLLTAVVVSIGLAQHRPATEMAVIGVSLAVAAVPESLPAVVTVALALGAHRMARRKAVVRNLPAVETLGSVTVIATDKTGTLTEGRMVAEQVWLPGGDGGAGRPLPGPGAVPALDRLLRDVVLCNDATLPGPAQPGSGDPLEVALLVLADEAGHVRRGWSRVAEAPFDAVRRRMATMHRRGDELVTVCKGAPETILALVPPGQATDLAAAEAERLADEGHRVIAVADRPGIGPADGIDESGLELAGLVAVDDPPRGHAPAVVDACHGAGIRLLLVTGDHPGTAHAVADRVGISAATDAEVDGVGPVFARVRPEQKVGIVESLQARGEVVAMLGDGVNDAPALRRADIGVAAGLGGTEVARQAADLVLMDDDLSTVVAAIEEGRRIFTNIRSFLLYAVSGGLAEVGVMLCGPLAGIADPLLPAQILWINLMTHGLTGVAFGAQPVDPAEMRQPPRPVSGAVFTRRFVTLLVLIAAMLVVVALGVGSRSSDVDEQRTLVFLTLGLGQLAVAWAIRSRAMRARELERRSVTAWFADHSLPVLVLLAAALMVLATAAGPLHVLLGTVSLGGAALATAAGASVLPAVVVAAVVRLRRRGGSVDAQGRRATQGQAF
ncbi:MAG TPA: cation-transporting P-type ATPase [Marmoricola sp.]|nr:cation-transporting P-type ATPase [Marmoricola sp.]